MRYVFIIIWITLSLQADNEVVLFDDIASLQKWYEEQLAQEDEIVNSNVDQEYNSTEIISSVKENNLSNPCLVQIQPAEEVMMYETNTTDTNQTAQSNEQSKSKYVESNISQYADFNITENMVKADRKKPIVIVKYYGDGLSQELCQSLSKEYIDFWNLLDLTLINASTMILKKHDIKITKENLEIIRSEYYPNLSIGYGGEYYHGFSRKSQTGPGGTFYPATSEFRDALSVDVQHELYRFGATDLKVKIGKKDIELVKKELMLQAEDISKRLLGFYTAALRAQTIIEYKEKMRLVQDRIIQKKLRLYESGQVTKIVLSKDRLAMVTLEKELSQQKLNLLKAIKNIELLANISIDTSRSIFAMLEPKNIKVKSFEESAAAKYLRLQLEKKLHELEYIKKEYLPGIYASGSYLMLGSDKALLRSIDALKRNSWDLGLNIRWDLFNGYKTTRQVDKIKYEIQKIMEKYKLGKIEFEAKRQEREMLQKSIDRILKVEAELYDQTCKQEEMLTRLHTVGIVDTLQLDYTEKNKLKSELDFKLGVIDKVYQTVSGEIIQ